MRALTLYVALGSSAYGHHSHFFDEYKSIAIEGRVERIEFKNPHNVLVLRLDDGTTYAVDWLSVTRLTSAGIIGAAKEAVVSAGASGSTSPKARASSRWRSHCSAPIDIVQPICEVDRCTEYGFQPTLRS
jgi:hypothetical protein